jgi:hypothetical protein
MGGNKDLPVLSYKNSVLTTVFISVLLVVVILEIFNFKMSAASLSLCIIVSLLVFIGNKFEANFYDNRMVYQRRFYGTRTVYYSEINKVKFTDLIFTGGGTIVTVEYYRDGKLRKMSFGRERRLGNMLLEDFLWEKGIKYE